MDLIRFKYGENNINTGPLKEIPEICIDHFFGNDLDSSVFLLSHAHTDHLVGLETDAFIRRLRQPGIRLYCHPLTPILLGSFERYLGGTEGIRKLISERKIVPLDVEKPKVLTIPRKSGHLKVVLTLLPAGHCPGSVMFLFETPTCRILHTGDFRLGLDDIKRMAFLHKNDKPKPVDHLYIDTTFCDTSANLFPNRKKVLREAFDSMRQWISLSNNHVISLKFSAKFAHEYVLLEINREFGQKIHVTPERRDIYRNIPEVFEIVTLEDNTKFHLCGNRDCLENWQFLTVRLSAMWYTKTKEANRDSFISWKGRHNMMLCYSMHSSLGEIAQTIDYLKPRVVTPLVLPVNSDISKIQSSLRSVTSTQYEFEDYRSSRNDFKNMETPSAPCPEERDATDTAADEVLENNEEIPPVSPTASLEEESIPHKRAKFEDEDDTTWDFKLTPSPKKNSQSSSEGSSQEFLNAHSSHFMKPCTPRIKPNPKRNFMETSQQFDPIPNAGSICDDATGSDEESFSNSQRL